MGHDSRAARSRLSLSLATSDFAFLFTRSSAPSLSPRDLVHALVLVLVEVRVGSARSE